MTEENMSRLEELIQQYCPDGVEWKMLGELGDFYSGLTGKTKSDFTGGNEKFITYVNVFNNPSLKTDVPERVKIAEGEKQNTIQYGDILFTGSYETPDECGMSSVLTHTIEEKLYLNSFCFGFRFFDLSDKCPSFMKYLFRSTNIRKTICKTANGVTRYNISKKEFAKIEIPIIPLPVQEEIVRILDTFTELQAELQAELQKRKQQYNYYLDNLLNFKNINRGGYQAEVRWMKMSEVASFTYGYTSKAQDLGNVRYIRITDITDKGQLNPKNGKYVSLTEEVRPYLLKKGDLIMARTGATYGKTLYYNEDYPSAYASFLIKITLNQLVDSKYYWHFTRSSIYWEQANRLVGGGAQPQFNTGAISQVIIPLPSLEEQNRIVSILDRFDRLTNDLTSGLPAEIEKRRQQYEYYRDKLLTFKRKGA